MMIFGAYVMKLEVTDSAEELDLGMQLIVVEVSAMFLITWTRGCFGCSWRNVELNTFGVVNCSKS